MYKRILDLEAVLKRKSVFLLGPRQTGKSTYLKSQFKQAHFINLLKNSEYKDLLIDPSSLERRVKYAFEEEKKSIVIIDEIQKIPALLDEVHNLIEQNKSLRFILTGSSARKLKREGVNMLGGRASSYKMLPLCYPELGTGKYEKWLKRLNIGALPSIMDSDSPVEDLKDYVSLYLNEEIKAEGISRSIDNFARFLEFSALINGEQLNFTSIGSDAQLSPSTVRDYFEVLQDTLIGTTLPAFLQTKKRKAMATSKFYFFDCGVTNALLGRKEVVQGTPEYGKMLEQAIFLELQAYLNYKGINKKLEYWRSTSQFEVDFLVYNDPKELIAIEVKASKNPTTKDFKGMKALEEDGKLTRKIVVCHISAAQKTADNIELLPVQIFLEKLWNGQIL